MKKNIIQITIVGFILFFIQLNGVFANENILKSAGFTPVNPPVKAPAIKLYNLDEDQVKLADFKGKVVLLFFWTTW